MPRSEHPTGWFEGEVTGHGFIEASTGTPQVFVGLRSDEGHEITAFLALTEAAVEHTVKKLRACGFKGFDFAQIEDGTLLVGNKVRYQVQDNEYNGQVRRQVGWINDPNSSPFERSQTAAQNARRFNDLLRANPPESTKPASTSPPPPPAPVLPGDIPF
jgi:hypothetical protein